MTRRFALPICLLLALLGAVPAHAATARHTGVKLVTCDTDAHAATFEGSMRAYGRAVGLQMRFTLQTRADGGTWERVAAPSFDEWLSAQPGKRAYVYDKQVNNLAVGASYRTVIRYRFRSAQGVVLARFVRRSPACRQPDVRPNLLVDRITLRPGGSASTVIYGVRVINDGDSAVSAFTTELTVDGNKLQRYTSTPLADGDETTVEFEAPRCAPGSAIIAGVDGAAMVDESDETDNSFTLACPGARRNG